MISKKKILIIAIVTVAVVAVTSVFLWQTLTASFAEVGEAIKTFLGKVNNYDTTGAWALTTTNYQDSWGEYIEFENLITALQDKQWNAQIQSISSRSVQTTNGIASANFTLTAKITDTEHTGQYTETWIFNLVKTDSQWKIDDWLTQD
jgi:Flp pilus assembly pilin Flp